MALVPAAAEKSANLDHIADERQLNRDTDQALKEARRDHNRKDHANDMRGLYASRCMMMERGRRGRGRGSRRNREMFNRAGVGHEKKISGSILSHSHWSMFSIGVGKIYRLIARIRSPVQI